MSAQLVGRYHPSREKLRARHTRNLVAAALAFESAHCRVQDLRASFGWGSSETSPAVEARKEARRRVLYFAARLNALEDAA